MGADDTSQDIQRRPGGRSARVRGVVLQAALEAMAERGPGGFTISEIAKRAGVHATSIQRRWGTIENVMLDALLSRSQELLPVPDTGALRGDLIAFARLIAAYLASPLGLALSRAMAVAEDDAELAEGRASFWRVRYDAVRVMFDRAVQRGELVPGVDPEVVLELCVAPLHFRALLVRRPIEDAVLEQMVDTLLRGVAASNH
ncbi:TetR/AcrR family transcriptional regulator C-terminal ligand-binding domain-containing protein [Mycobacteroides franklinii]|uniref:TetR/AcrR family transcriptional regulator C-terminal ligand-binding domain-containing protein n=1 Tax=Mycobacteroides franklinii TaxID=948102 RepID=UPI0013E8D256|nr:TetR family transcriptional regulator [Mycobacteroides franklinii]